MSDHPLRIIIILIASLNFWVCNSQKQIPVSYTNPCFYAGKFYGII